MQNGLLPSKIWSKFLILVQILPGWRRLLDLQTGICRCFSNLPLQYSGLLLPTLVNVHLWMTLSDVGVDQWCSLTQIVRLFDCIVCSFILASTLLGEMQTSFGWSVGRFSSKIENFIFSVMLILAISFIFVQNKPVGSLISFIWNWNSCRSSWINKPQHVVFVQNYIM